MIELNTADIASITGGRITATTDPGSTVSGVATDSRECASGFLFVAKPGEVSDGHHFIDRAFAAGAILALSEHETLDSGGTVHPAVIVDDAVVAMGALAAHMVELLRSGGTRVIGITGSAGKTTTKDLLAAILETSGPTVAPIGSYNGEVGVPLTVFNATAETRYLVIEMGATGIGHITYLTDMVHPDTGVVLCVGTAHAGEFGGVENIARAKGELVEALPGDGTAILNLDDPRVAAMAARTEANILGFAMDDGGSRAPVMASDIVIAEGGYPEFTLNLPDGGSHRVRSGLIGRHHVSNLLAAAAAAYSVGIDGSTIAATLQDRGPASRWRMERTERPDGVSIVNDAYNANPESMRAALRTLAELGLPTEAGVARRTWAVLGEMLELGSESIHEHDLVGRLAVRLNIKKLVVVGPGAKAAYNSAVLEGSWGDEAYYVETPEDAEALLADQLEPGDIVLFKSSNSAGLRHLGDRVASSPCSNGASSVSETEDPQ
ncbi:MULTISPECIES: UDP-N-acetylmuramoyl-tripeptide--D-alanyl-D-alanine ligase [Micrococcaceae]|uniref:UDP-N-acetylmuramoyl-tripeptide--D-alanyl-D-alanine ligase n=1 Tax=Arthrobacter rhombi TaxID=71253 RepID=A0A1R4GMX8_9MICC|nr:MULTISPECIES: UDP-N-acetylmuramoyl-tripeptide--D-alanyl-D-alanine ligase [Micrococcaceae]PCC26289.1 UDP-N-acetylmuramoyl-tripeptide--D-alanyl-D-alanine ligase [Glutamicibacter sp. BW78]SJM69474.1 UDP-N-acetylmuramoylalanyl-D-glutamyl-2,6-diaminopimelate--D-alanyl-D-alanine ligase [Arthrobacter rhombi]